MNLNKVVVSLRNFEKMVEGVQKLNSNRKNAAGAESMVDGGIMCCAKYKVV